MTHISYFTDIKHPPQTEPITKSDEEAPFLENQKSKRVKRGRQSHSSWSDFEEDILSRSSHSNKPLEEDGPVSSVPEPPADVSLLLESDTELPNDKGSVSEDNSDHLSPSIFPKRPPTTPPARKSRQHSKESGSLKQCPSASTPHWGKKTPSQRQLFDSEDEFDMSVSHPPPFKNCTPSKKLKTPKRRKILKSLADDEEISSHSNESKPPTLKTEGSVSPSPHSRDGSKDADTDDASNSVKNEPIDDAQALNSDDKTVNAADSSTKFIEKEVKNVPKEAKNVPKEAKNVPKKISCCACGQMVFWKRKPLLKHPRLDVLVCQVSYVL